MSKKKLYWILSISCASGYLWLFISHWLSQSNTGFELCPTKRLLHVPCPSCGSTRSILSIVRGDFWHAFLINPLGYFLTFCLLVVPFWLIYDMVLKKSSLQIIYQKIESFLRKPLVALLFILLILINWLWNIYKYN